MRRFIIFILFLLILATGCQPQEVIVTQVVEVPITVEVPVTVVVEATVGPTPTPVPADPLEFNIVDLEAIMLTIDDLDSGFAPYHDIENVMTVENMAEIKGQGFADYLLSVEDWYGYQQAYEKSAFIFGSYLRSWAIWFPSEAAAADFMDHYKEISTRYEWDEMSYSQIGDQTVALKTLVVGDAIDTDIFDVAFRRSNVVAGVVQNFASGLGDFNLFQEYVEKVEDNLLTHQPLGDEAVETDSAVDEQSGTATPQPSATESVVLEQPQIGDETEFNGYSVTVIQVADPGNSGILYEEEAGKRLVGVEIIVANNEGEQLLASLYGVSLVDSNGFVYESEYGQIADELTSTNLNPGEKIRGWVGFVIPQDAIPAAFRYQFSGAPNSDVTISLQ